MVALVFFFGGGLFFLYFHLVIWSVKMAELCANFGWYLRNRTKFSYWMAFTNPALLINFCQKSMLENYHLNTGCIRCLGMLIVGLSKDNNRSRRFVGSVDGGIFCIFFFEDWTEKKYQCYFSAFFNSSSCPVSVS